MITASKHRMKLQSLNAAARKVYEAVPISEPWSLSFISGELQRQGVSVSRDIKVIHGCLGHMESVGLVTQPAKDMFIRVAVKPELVEEKPPMTTKPFNALPIPAELVKKPDASKHTTGELMIHMSEKLRALADELEGAAMAVDQQLEDAKAKLVKFDQLQAILKSLS